MSCPICEKRKSTRFCPAKGERICAVCCGVEREVTIDCPPDCTYLAAAHRYEDEHPRSIPAYTPLLDVKLPKDLLHTHQQLLGALAFAIAKFCARQPSASDPDVLKALESLAETYRTLTTGIFYEKLPDAPLPRDLYGAVMTLLAELKKEQAERTGFFQLKDGDIFHLLVFLFRMGLLRSNGKPRSRRFVEFLRGQFPQAQELKREKSRIIVP